MNIGDLKSKFLPYAMALALSTGCSSVDKAQNIEGDRGKTPEPQEKSTSEDPSRNRETGENLADLENSNEDIRNKDRRVGEEVPGIGPGKNLEKNSETKVRVIIENNRPLGDDIDFKNDPNIQDLSNSKFDLKKADGVKILNDMNAITGASHDSGEKVLSDFEIFKSINDILRKYIHKSDIPEAMSIEDHITEKLQDHGGNDADQLINLYKNNIGLWSKDNDVLTVWDIVRDNEGNVIATIPYEDNHFQENP